MATHGLFTAILAAALLSSCTTPYVLSTPTAGAVPNATVSAAVPAPTPSPSAQRETLKIGVLAPSTGVAARTGIVTKRLIELAVADLNTRGGVKVGGKEIPISLTTADDHYTTEGGRDAADKLMRDGVRFIFGPLSPVTPGAQAAAEPAKTLIFASGAADSSLGTAFPHTFHIGWPLARMRWQAIYDSLRKERPDASRLAIITSDDPKRVPTDPVEALGGHFGFTVIAKQWIPADAPDISEAVDRVIAQRPDVIALTGSSIGPLLFVLFRTLHERAFHNPVMGLVGDANSLHEIAPYGDRYTTALLADRNSPLIGPGEQDVIGRYISRFGEQDLDLSLLGMYNGPGILAQAIEQADSIDDTTRIAQVLRIGEWQTIWAENWGPSRFVGKETFGVAQVLEQPIYLTRVQGGVVATFQAVEAALP